MTSTAGCEARREWLLVVDRLAALFALKVQVYHHILDQSTAPRSNKLYCGHCKSVAKRPLRVSCNTTTTGDHGWQIRNSHRGREPEGDKTTSASGAWDLINTLSDWFILWHANCQRSPSPGGQIRSWGIPALSIKTHSLCHGKMIRWWCCTLHVHHNALSSASSSPCTAYEDDLPSWSP